MRSNLIVFICLLAGISCFGQGSWTVCNAPAFNNRVDDVYMVNAQTGYAVSGDGKIVKTVDGGENWTLMVQTPLVYCRSVEFINEQKGFVGGFPALQSGVNALRRTNDGGQTWTDLSPLLPQRVRRGGICGLSVADENTIYGGGNWFQDSAYLVKSSDGGTTWNFIDMKDYASGIIDMFFLNKDTGFVTGMGKKPLRSAIILYTTNGGQSWTTVFENHIQEEYCWKIQRLTKMVWVASIEDFGAVPPRVLRSNDGGMTWKVQIVSQIPYNIEGIGFIDPMHGWTGGGPNKSFETTNGGKTWDSVAICPLMNRVFRVNDTTIIATGNQIWKYKGKGTYPAIPADRYAWMKAYPNPVKDNLLLDVSVAMNTRVLISVHDQNGKRLAVIENADKARGSYQYSYNTSRLAPGMYYVTLKTHEDKGTIQVIVAR